MLQRSQRKELFGAIVGVGLLLFAMAWRWLLPTLDSLHWFTPPPLLTAASSGPAPEPLAVTHATANPSSDAVDAEMSAPIPLDPAQQQRVEQLLAQAVAAMKARRWLEPSNDNALDWYLQALTIAPQQAAARSGRDAVLELLFQQADQALDEGDDSAANELIGALNQRQLADPRATELARRRKLLDAIRPLLAEAASRLAAGQSFEPADASAVSIYHTVLALDARNQSALKGLASLEAGLLDRALAVAADENFSTAETLLTAAAALLPGSSAWARARKQVDTLKHRRAEDLLTRADTALAARDIATAKDLLASAQTLGATAEDTAALEQMLANASLYANYQPGESFRDAFKDRSGETPTMVVIPVGSFRIGAADSEAGRQTSEVPQRLLAMQTPFAIASTEVTVAEFRRFVRDSGYVTVAEKTHSSIYYDEASGRMAERQQIDWRNDFIGGKARANDPVVHVAWLDAEAYAAWLGEKTALAYRLPSEAEFEYVLRGGSQSAYPWGDGMPDKVFGNLTGDADRSRSKRGWDKALPHYRDGYWGPAPVAQFAANPFGVFDLVGNVSEWVADCWHENYLRAPTDGRAWVNRGCEQRVVRGSSWGSAPEQSRSAYRSSASADTRSARTGFRVVRAL